ACGLERAGATLTGTDPRYRVDRDGPDLPVADPAGLCRLHDHADQVVAVLVLAQHFQPDLGHQVNPVFGPPVDLGVAALPAIATGLAHGHAMDPERLQCSLDLVQLEWLDHRGDELHATTFSGTLSVPTLCPGRFTRQHGVFRGRERRASHVTRTFPGLAGRDGGQVTRVTGIAGAQTADVRPVLGWTHAADASNPLSRLQAPPHPRGRRGARRWATLPQTRNPAGGFTGSRRRPERDRDSSTNWQAKPAGSPVHSLGPASRRHWKEPMATVGLPNPTDGLRARMPAAWIK